MFRIWFYLSKVCVITFLRNILLPRKHVFGDSQVKIGPDICLKRFWSMLVSRLSSLIHTEILQQVLEPLNLVQILKVIRG